MRHPRQRQSKRFWTAAATLVICLAVPACTPKRQQPGAAAGPPPSAAHAPGVPVNTIVRSAIGDRLTTTASVAEVLAQRAFVLDDADLPDRGLLVLTEATDGVRPASLVTVSGAVGLFRFGEFADAYGLGAPDPYRRFENRKLLVADHVRSWA